MFTNVGGKHLEIISKSFHSVRRRFRILTNLLEWKNWRGSGEREKWPLSFPGVLPFYAFRFTRSVASLAYSIVASPSEWYSETTAWYHPGGSSD